MSEQEFELYLSLLSKLLKLDKNQQAEISDEMRDHLEARFEDLVVQGHDRRKAIELALDEFGDANVLAGEFSQLAIKQRRRKIMRLTFGTIITSACLILALQSFWPEAHVPNQNRFVTSSSQADQEPEDVAKPTKATAKSKKEKPTTETVWIYTSYSDAEKKIEEALNKKVSLDFQDAPLQEIMDYIRELAQIPIIIKRNHLEEEGIDPDDGMVTFANQCTLRSALNIILEQFNLTYRIQDEFLIVDTITGSLNSGLITRVYNCRDLLSVPSFPVENDGTYYDPNGTNSRNRNSGSGGAGGGASGFGGGGGGFSVQDQITSQLGSAVVNQFAGGTGNNPQNPEPVASTKNDSVQKRQVPPQEIKYSPSQIREKILIDVIQKSTGNYSTWNSSADLGEGGSTIQAYFGMIILTAPESLHREVVELLEMLRESFRRDNLLNEELSRHNRGYEVMQMNVQRYNSKTGKFESVNHPASAAPFSPPRNRSRDDEDEEDHSHGDHSHDDDNDNASGRRRQSEDDDDRGKLKPKKENSRPVRSPFGGGQ